MSNYCIHKGFLCQLATEFGYCSQTACTRNYPTNSQTYTFNDIVLAEWKMVLDDFDNGYGNREYPHCSKCGRGVYRHDAGSWCPFCGAAMKNPMRY